MGVAKDESSFYKLRKPFAHLGYAAALPFCDPYRTAEEAAHWPANPNSRTADVLIELAWKAAALS